MIDKNSFFTNLLMRDPDESGCSERIPFDDEGDGGCGVALRAPRYRLTQPEHASTR